MSIFPRTYRGLLAKIGDRSTESLEASATQGSDRYGPATALLDPRPPRLGDWEGAREKKPSGAIPQGKQTACLCVRLAGIAKEGLVLGITL